MSATDYRAIYEGYWARPDRWGSHSFEDGRALADQILTVCGPGRTLDVGCGMGLLVRTLISRGVDAVGTDVAPACIAHGNSGAPGRFVEGSILALPFEDDAFETVVSTDVLEHLDEKDVDAAIAELARVARGSLFVRLATAPDRDGTWHLTVRAREWWEERFIAAGLRKHPGAHRVLPYGALDSEGSQITLVFEKVAAKALRAHPLQSLRAARDLHMDMAREAGRRSDAHLARYAYASQFVRPGDVVLDAACGLGYGAAVLARTTGAARVIGVDRDGGAVGYAQDCYLEQGGAPGVVEFREGTLPDLSFLADRSVDLVTCFETLEHVTDPAALLAEFSRVLTPGGRVVVSVPNDWTDESGKDPNPHHLHVYTWDRLGAELADQFLVERCAAQTAGGGMKLTDRPRRIAEAAFASRDDASPALNEAPEAEWWLAVAMKSPLGAGKDGYRESAFGDGVKHHGYHLTAFARDYDNPWLVRSMVSIGMRATREGLLRHLAQETRRTARAGSPDVGAALCVLAYQELERSGDGETAGAPVGDLLGAIDAYDAAADGSAHTWRWRISNRYVGALLHLACGRRDEARAAFEACAAMDCTRFSPLLASKTVDAAFQAGAIAAADGDAGAARELWTRGVREAERVLSGPWLNVLGDAERPMVFGLPEVGVVADLASRCAYGLDMLARRPASSAQVWAAAQTQTFADARRWARSLADAKGWLESELARQREQSRTQARTIDELREWNAQQDQGRAWLEEQRVSLAAAAAGRDAVIESLRAQLAASEKAREWFAAQTESWKTAAERAAAELRGWSDSLRESKAWLEGQVAQRDARVAELKAWTDELTRGRDWLESQRRSLGEGIAARDAKIAELRAWSEELVRGKNWNEARAAQLESAVRSGAEESASLRARAGELEGLVRELAVKCAWLEGQVERLDRCVVTRVRAAGGGVPAPGAPNPIAENVQAEPKAAAPAGGEESAPALIDPPVASVSESR